MILISESANAAGGAEKVALDSAIGLADAGIQVIVFSGSEEVRPDLNRPNLKVVFSGGKHVRDWPSKVDQLRHGIWNERTASAMRDILTPLDPAATVVHAHSYMNIHTPSVLGAVVKAGFALVVTGHDYGLACPTLGFYDSRTESICPLRGLSRACVASKCTGTSYANKLGFVLRSSKMRGKAGLPVGLKHLIAVSEGSGAILKPYLPNATIHLVVNPIDIEKPNDRTRAEENSEFGFIARLTPEKDPTFFVRAASEAGVPAIVLGDGPAKAAAEAANPNADFWGQVGKAKVDEGIRRMRCLVMTSRWYEAAPLVIQEAHARGIPVIVPDVCAGKDAVRHGETGFHYRGGDLSDLAGKMRELGDQSLCKTMSENAFSEFWDNAPTMERHVRELLQVYGEALARR